MKDFFNLMSNVANSDNRKYTSILELTKDIANSAGYSLEKYTQKNGKTKVRTIYTKPWDDALVAKWFMFYSKYFKSKLYALPALKEYHTLILNRTFSIYFNALKLDKLKSDKAVTAYIKLTFSNRIGEAMYMMGSETKLKENIERKKLRQDIKNGEVEDMGLSDTRNKCSVKNAFNENTASLEQLKEDVNFDVKSNDQDLSSVMLDLRHELEGKELGLRLLDCTLYSGKKVVFSNLSNYMNFKNSELVVNDNGIELKDEIKQQLADSYNTIVEYLKDIFLSEDFSKTKRTFKYSSSDNCISL